MEKHFVRKKNITDTDNNLHQYVCCLDEESLAKAQKEFNENQEDRVSSLKSFRSWIAQQKDWLHTPTESSFLMSFLRMRKFSQLMARQSLVNYWSARSSNGQWFRDVDPCDKIVHEIIDCGSLVLLPGRDKHGRKVILLRPGKIDGSMEYTNDQIYKSVFILGDYLLRDENVQVNGFVIITDFTYLSIRNRNTQMSQNLRKNFAIWAKVYPLHIKEIHHYNMGAFGDFLFTLAKPFLPHKIQKRVFNHGSLYQLYEYVDKDMLPNEYLPDDCIIGAGEITALLDNMKREISTPEVRAYIACLSSSQYYVDEEKRPRDDVIQHATYRKMDI